jgi:hypothetical protein
MASASRLLATRRLSLKRHILSYSQTCVRLRTYEWPAAVLADPAAEGAVCRYRALALELDVEASNVGIPHGSNLASATAV